MAEEKPLFHSGADAGLPSFPSAANPSSSEPPPARLRSKKPLWLGSGAACVLVGFWWFNPLGSKDVDVSDLPVWFSKEYRIGKPASAAEPVHAVPGVGVLIPPRKQASPGTLPEDVFEKEFTHYTRIPLFVWATPVWVYPSHGKINPGLKVIFGKQVDQKMTLICIRTQDGKPMNMFIENGYLIDRAQMPQGKNKGKVPQGKNKGT
jgi:hypothetical protein